jgi:hypothetical protein
VKKKLLDTAKKQKKVLKSEKRKRTDCDQGKEKTESVPLPNKLQNPLGH